MASSIRWYGHVLRRSCREQGIRFRCCRANEEREAEEDIEKAGEEENVKVGLRRKDALCRSKWSVGVNQIATGLR